MDKTQLLQAILNNIMGGVILCNFNCETQSSQVVYINSGWTKITGYTLEELNREKDGNPQALILSEDRENADREYREQIHQGSEYELMYRVLCKNGTVIWVIDKGVILPLPDGTYQNQSIITEVTKIKEQEEKLRLLAQIDQLTDLNNKATFSLMAQAVLTRQQNKLHALMMLDIDHFKCINDTWGHTFGDEVLEHLATRLKEFFRSRDVLGRVGGDEFLVLMTGVPSRETVVRKANELCAAIRGIKLAGHPHPPITVSIGVAFSQPGLPYDALFEQADAALYRAKNRGRDNYALYESSR